MIRRSLCTACGLGSLASRLASVSRLRLQRLARCHKESPSGGRARARRDTARAARGFQPAGEFPLTRVPTARGQLPSARAIIGCGLGIPAEVLRDAMEQTAAPSSSPRRELARQEGIFCGISAGATLAAALAVARTAPKGSRILFMAPDTGERYLSTLSSRRSARRWTPRRWRSQTRRRSAASARRRRSRRPLRQRRPGRRRFVPANSSNKQSTTPISRS